MVVNVENYLECPLLTSSILIVQQDYQKIIEY